jgi:hypothetical protein
MNCDHSMSIKDFFHKYKQVKIFSKLRFFLKKP